MTFQFLRPFFLSLFIGTVAMAQPSGFSPPVSAGKIDGRFILSTRTNATRDINSLRSVSGKVPKDRAEFIVDSWYDLGKFAQGGTLLCGDEMSSYLQQIADRLLRDDPQTRAGLHVYVTRSAVANASMKDEGYIFVNAGLLAQVENEAQLAFVLARNIVLYKNKNNARQFSKRKALMAEGIYGNALRDAMRDFSKEQQLQADSDGLDMLKKAGYDLSQSLNALDVLFYAYLPFDDVTFDRHFLEDENLKLPDTYFLAETKAISSDDNFDDSNSSHPNVHKRKEALGEKIAKAGEPANALFQVSEEKFRSMQQTARFEMCRQLEIKRNYPQAVYSAYMLLQKYPENFFLKRIIANSLYNLAVYKMDTTGIALSEGNETVAGETNLNIDNNTSGKYKLPSYDKVEGRSQQVYYLLNKLSAEETGVLALSWAWKMRREQPEDKMLNRTCEQLFALLAEEHDLTPESFSKKNAAESKTVPADTVKKEDTGGSKYDKIKKQRSQTDVSGEGNFAHYAFAGFLADTAFVNRFRSAVSRVEENRKAAEQEKERKRNHAQIQLGIDKIIVVDPMFVNPVDLTMNGIYETEDYQEKLGEYIVTAGKSVNLECVLVDPNHLDSSDTKSWNELAALRELLSARMEHGATDRTMTGLTLNCESLIAHYGTRYCLWPCAIATPMYYSKKTVYYSILVDLETGDWMYTNTDLQFKPISFGFMRRHVKKVVTDIQRR